MYTRATQSMYYKQNKKNCSDYKKAVDLRKRSGGGRILITFYDVKIYGLKPQLLQVYPMDLIHQWFQRIAL